MKTGHLLFLSGINRDTYNTNNRRGNLRFLARDIDNPQRQDRFKLAHALAMSAFVMLRRLGVDPAIAGAAVDESWPDIKRVVDASSEPLRSEHCGPRINSLGIEDTWGWPHPKAGNALPVATASVNLRMLWEWMQPSVRECLAAEAISSDEA